MGLPKANVRAGSHSHTPQSWLLLLARVWGDSEEVIPAVQAEDCEFWGAKRLRGKVLGVPRAKTSCLVLYFLWVICCIHQRALSGSSLFFFFFFLSTRTGPRTRTGLRTRLLLELQLQKAGLGASGLAARRIALQPLLPVFILAPGGPTCAGLGSVVSSFMSWLVDRPMWSNICSFSFLLQC